VGRYYAEDGYPFAEVDVRASLSRLIAEPARGQAWVLDEQGRLDGYAILTLGYSLEYGGLDAFVDELYVTPGRRGRGLGGQALELAERECLRRGVRALHLEVEHDKRQAQELYRRWGFADHRRYLMTKRLSAGRVEGTRR
jgi:GNAT superfamily N-acetyltransferase